ncbi:transporter substrate-binding domain-containing protein [Gluconobacter cerinus]|nr:transporter substrate-binding domain-containing protein [Gluconobacter cerinus]
MKANWNSLLLGFCAVSGALWGGGAGARDSAVIRASGHINIGVEPGLPPLGEYDDHNELAGYDVDIGRQIARGMGVEPRFVTLASSGRIPYLMAGKVDIVLGGLTLTPGRAEVIAFSHPLYSEQFAVITPADRGITSFADLESGVYRLIEVRGSTAVAYLRQRVPKARMLLLENYADAIRALAQGRGDAMVDVIEYVGHYLPSQPQVHWRIIRGFAPPVGDDCIGMSRQDVALRGDVNRILDGMEHDGRLEKIHRRWFDPVVAERAP